MDTTKAVQREALRDVLAEQAAELGRQHGRGAKALALVLINANQMVTLAAMRAQGRVDADGVSYEARVDQLMCGIAEILANAFDLEEDALMAAANLHGAFMQSFGALNGVRLEKAE